MAMKMFSAAATADTKMGLLAFFAADAALEVEDADHGDPNGK